MNRFIRAVLFDLNETLIHQIRTERSHIASTYAPLAQADWSITFESFEAAWMSVHQKATARYLEGITLLRAGEVERARELLAEPWYRENIAAILAHLNVPPTTRMVARLTWAFQDS